MAALEGRFDFKTAEPALQQRWDEAGIYRFDPHHPGPPFTVDTPPPTVSGRIHVGHVYSYTQADVMIRYHRMKGEQVFYPFGFDDNGLPTEIFTENSKGIRARDVGRRAFIEACLALSQEVEGQFERFWKRLGLSVDWRLRYSTIDDRSRRVSQAAFLDLYRRDNVYRQEAPTLWCTTCQTGVA
ncbi:MAG: class I tRNA ligase family protein, partial [Chloroflexota bacterium]|nr:class I tRNA ligase family protein [Chloroflexota bacterium]